MTLFDVFGERRARDAYEETWGHLRPQVGVKYSGEILFTQGDYGDLTVIQSNFPGLPDSPWFYDDQNNFIGEKAKEAGTVYRFTGTYRKCKNGRGIFAGKVKKVKL